MIEKLFNKFGYYKRPEHDTDSEIINKAVDLFTMVKGREKLWSHAGDEEFHIVHEIKTGKIYVKDPVLDWIIE
jgi:hypothetical protein